MQSRKLNEKLIYRLGAGEYYKAYETFGAHPTDMGASFTVSAPNAKSVQVVGDFNNWGNGPCGRESDLGRLEKIDSGGIFHGTVPHVKCGDLYKYLIEANDGTLCYKADPFALYAEQRPGTASVIFKSSYKWHDDKWMDARKSVGTAHLSKPKNIYEVHLGSFRHHNGRVNLCSPCGNDSVNKQFNSDFDLNTCRIEDFYTYRELAASLVPYVKRMGYTHVEFLPVMEHPFDGSWGYQTTGYFAPTSRYGSPDDLKYLIDSCHKAGLGVILDWVPGHFCKDEHGLANFDGTPLYESEIHPDWGTYKFNFSSGYVRSFLLSSAMYWIEAFHADGLRVDGVSSMLYMNFGISDNKKKKYNPDGSEDNKSAVSFLQKLNTMMGEYHPDVMMIAEESTAWPLVTAPPDAGGLGFHYKWNMGWMNDTLEYMKTDFPFRPGVHNKLTFSMSYAFSENFILPLSHDEVVHGKCSLIGRMPGDYWRKFAGLRLLNMFQMTHPGGKLNFMGNEFAQFVEWRFFEPLEWFLLDYEAHANHQQFVKDLNHLYLKEHALWSDDHSWNGFRWLDADNNKQCIYSYIRRSKGGKLLITVLNAEVNPHERFRIGVPSPGIYREIFSSDSPAYGGSGQLNTKMIEAERIPYHGQKYSIEITVPPLGGTIIKRK